MDDIKRTEFGLIDRSDELGDGVPNPNVVTMADTDVADHNEAQKALLSARSVIDKLAEKPLIGLVLLAIEPAEDGEEVSVVVVGAADPVVYHLARISATIIGDVMAFEEQNDA